MLTNFRKIATMSVIALAMGAFVVSCGKDVVKVEVTPTTKTLAVGETAQLSATVTPSNATNAEITWSSSTPATATVDQNGKVTAIAVGTSTITAEAGGKTGTCLVTVGTVGPDPSVQKVFIEDVEAHTAFTINSTLHGWSYIDGDASSTYGFSGISFTGSGEEMSYIVFDPSQTSPALTSFDVHSGTKAFACFAATTAANDDYLITPELTNPSAISFYAATYVDDYGMERMRVAYSTTGKNANDFSNALTAGSYVEVPAGSWTKYTYTLPANAKYVAIQCVSDDAFIFFVDDIEITAVAAGNLPEKNTAKSATYNNFNRNFVPVAKAKK